MNGLKQRLEEIKAQGIRTYKIIDLALDAARSNEELQVQGSYLYVLSFDGTELKLKLNDISNDDLPLRQHRGVSGIFHRIFLSHIAQAGKTAKLVIGVKTEFSIEDWG